jgi:hypothetical protein
MVVCTDPLVTVVPMPVVGPRLVPFKLVRSPGETVVGAKEAPLSTVIPEGAACVTTVKVMFTVCGELEAFAEVMVTVPLYVPAARPVGFTATVSAVGVPPVAAVVPLVGVTLSQVPPAGVVAAAAVKLMAAALLVRLMVWLAGVAPPVTKLKDRDVGVTPNVPEP